MIALGYIGFIIDSEKENLNDVDEAGDYQRVIAVLKDKIVIRNVESIESSMTYKDLSQKYNYDFNSINRETVFQILSRRKFN